MSDPRSNMPVDFAALLDELDQLVAAAKTVPLSASVMVNRAEIDGLLADLRDAVPEEVRQARWVLKERDEILDRAETEAHRVLEDAKLERERVVAGTEVAQAAGREAERIVDDAKEHGRQIRLEAEDYVDAKLANFEVVLHKTLGAVERGRDKLRGRLDTDQLAEADFDDLDADEA